MSLTKPKQARAVNVGGRAKSNGTPLVELVEHVPGNSIAVVLRIGGDMNCKTGWTAEGLRAMAKEFNELAEALDEA